MARDSENGRLSAAELSQAALLTVEELTSHKAESVTGLEWDGECWLVTVDALELARIPNSMDVLGSYQVRLDDEGTLRGYRRLRRFRRAQQDEEE
jgi:hypothetical protein